MKVLRPLQALNSVNIPRPHCKPLRGRSGLYKRMETTLAAEPVSVPSIAAGELADFDAVVRKHQPAVFRFLLASLREREPAENLTQECFLNAYRGRHSFRGAASVRTWLMRIAVNLVIDHRKSVRLRFWRRAAQTSLDVAFTGDWLADRRSSP